jgi:cysteine desulfurase
VHNDREGVATMGGPIEAGESYLDYNATAPLRPEALAASVDAMQTVGNASSLHGAGRRAAEKG